MYAQQSWPYNDVHLESSEKYNNLSVQTLIAFGKINEIFKGRISLDAHFSFIFKPAASAEGKKSQKQLHLLCFY